MLKPLVGTPCFGSQVFRNYLMSVIDLKGVCGMSGIPIEFAFGGDSLITRARNNCVKGFLEGDYTHLFFIDADIGFDSADFLNLLMAGKPVICANYRLKTDSMVSYAGKGVTDVGDDGIGKIKYGPTGFMCIERSVFETLKHPDIRLRGNQWRFFDTMVDEDHVYLSEDYAFCRRCEMAGIDVLVDTKIKLTHMGLKTYD